MIAKQQYTRGCMLRFSQYAYNAKDMYGDINLKSHFPKINTCYTFNDKINSAVIGK